MKLPVCQKITKRALSELTQKYSEFAIAFEVRAQERDTS